MINFEHEKDRLRFKKRNLAEGKKLEEILEAQRVEQGIVHQFRRVLIDKTYRPSFMPKRDI